MLFSTANAADSSSVPSTAPVNAATSIPSAPTGAAAGEPSPVVTMMPLLLIILVFYMLIIRPQQKRMREHESMVKGVTRGDKVVTGGGVIGTVSRVEDDVLTVEIAPDVKIRVLRETISHIHTKTGVANDNKSEG